MCRSSSLCFPPLNYEGFECLIIFSTEYPKRIQVIWRNLCVQQTKANSQYWRSFIFCSLFHPHMQVKAPSGKAKPSAHTIQKLCQNMGTVFLSQKSSSSQTFTHHCCSFWSYTVNKIWVKMRNEIDDKMRFADHPNSLLVKGNLVT